MSANSTLSASFSYTETNPTSYTMWVCTNGASDAACDAAYIAKKVSSTNLSGATRRHRGTAVPEKLE